jgi:hypothetical protein
MRWKKPMFALVTCFGLLVLGGIILRAKANWLPDPLVEPRHDDWVVALLPRFFEQALICRLGNDIGSAGFNGFDTKEAKVENIKFIHGRHSAFLKQIPEIVNYIRADVPDPAGELTRRGWPVLHWVSDWACWAVWILIIVLVVGFWLIIATKLPIFVLPFTLAYLLFLLWVLYEF